MSSILDFIFRAGLLQYTVYIKAYAGQIQSKSKEFWFCELCWESRTRTRKIWPCFVITTGPCSFKKWLLIMWSTRTSKPLSMNILSTIQYYLIDLYLKCWFLTRYLWSISINLLLFAEVGVQNIITMSTSILIY